MDINIFEDCSDGSSKFLGTLRSVSCILEESSCIITDETKSVHFRCQKFDLECFFERTVRLDIPTASLACFKNYNFVGVEVPGPAVANLEQQVLKLQDRSALKEPELANFVNNTTQSPQHLGREGEAHEGTITREQARRQGPLAQQDGLLNDLPGTTHTDQPLSSSDSAKSHPPSDVSDDDGNSDNDSDDNSGGNMPFTCTGQVCGCGASFANGNALRRHKRAAARASGAFTCTVNACGRTFGNRGTLTRHVRTVHGLDPQGQPVAARQHFCGFAVCPMSSRGFYAAADLARHWRNVHG